MFNAGFGIFTLGSLFCGLSPGISWLIFSRGIQAIGGALMQANSGAIIADTFPPNVRGTAFGYLSLGWTSGAVLGIVLGGVITTYVGWEYIFFINIPIGIAATVLGVLYLTDNPRVNARLDITGMVLLGAALTFISFSGVDFATEGTALLNIVAILSRPGLHRSLRALRTADRTTHHRFFRTAQPDPQIFHDGGIFPQSRVPVGGVSHHDVPAGHPCPVASRCRAPPHAGICRGQPALAVYGQAFRPVRGTGACNLRHRDAHPCNAHLRDVQGRYPALGGAGRIGHLRPRDGDVLSLQQQCRHGKRPAGFLWRDIRYPPDHAEYRDPGKFRDCHHGLRGLNTEGCGVCRSSSAPPISWAEFPMHSSGESMPLSGRLSSSSALPGRSHGCGVTRPGGSAPEADP